MHELDEIDKKLLNKLQQNNRITAEELGSILNLSTSAVQRRLTRLRRDKIIEADISIISPEAMGVGMTCIVEVSLELASVVESFKSLLSACPEVTQCYYVAGTFDFILFVSTRDMKHYEEFSKKYLMDNSNVKQYYTHVVLDKVKVSYGVTI